MTGIAADIEHGIGPQQMHGSADKLLLLLPILAAVVAGVCLVLAPSRIASGWFQGMQRSAEGSQVSLENRGGNLRLLLEFRRRSGSALPGLKQVRKRYQGTKRRAPAFPARKVRVQVHGLIAIAAIQRGRQGPAQVFVSCQRQ